jgi:hypothetical protein
MTESLAGAVYRIAHSCDNFEMSVLLSSCAVNDSSDNKTAAHEMPAVKCCAARSFAADTASQQHQRMLFRSSQWCGAEIILACEATQPPGSS